MANFKDLLNKNKSRLEQMEKPRKKMKRTGPKRPWQENLDQYKDDQSEKPKVSDQNESKSIGTEEVLNVPSGSPDEAVTKASDSPTLSIHNSEISDSKKPSVTIPAQNQHNTNTSSVDESFTNQHNSDTTATQLGDIVRESLVIDNEHNTDTKAHSEKTTYQHKANTTSDIDLDDYKHKADTENVSHISLKVNRGINTDTKSTQSKRTSRHNTGTDKNVSPGKSRHNTDTNTGGKLSSEVDKPSVNKRHDTDTIVSDNASVNRHNSDTIPTQTKRGTGTNRTHSLHKADTLPTPSSTHYQHISIDNSDTISRQLRTLRGHKLKIFNYCYETTVANNYMPFRTTYDSLALSTGVSLGSIRTTTKRLKAEGLLNLVSLGKGRGALIEVVVPDEACKAHTRNLKTNTIPTQIVSGLRHNTDTQPDTNVSSSSSNLNNNTNTNYESDSELTGEWLEIITPDSLKEISFGKTQLMQLKRVGTLTPLEVQESLDAFAYDLEAGTVKSFGSKLSFLMGIMRKGNSYISEAYMSEVRQAMDRQKALREEREKLKKEEIQEKLSQKARQEYEKLSDEEKLELVPENNLAKVNSQVHERMVLAKLIEKMGS